MAVLFVNDEHVIPLWNKDVVLRWRFQENFANNIYYPELINRQTVVNEVRGLINNATLAWGSDVAPIKFIEQSDNWDFEVIGSNIVDDYPASKAFNPNTKRNELIIYPCLFMKSPERQINTLAHEMGHIFGFLHSFVSDPMATFGSSNVKNIMNVGIESVLTDDDRNDVQHLYAKARSGELANINGIPIRLVNPHDAII